MKVGERHWKRIRGEGRGEDEGIGLVVEDGE
jgi:hypothetical protein